MKLAAGFLASLLLNMASWIVTAIGLPVVWFALPYARPVGEPRAFTQFPNLGHWELLRLPRWARWWDNAFDGMLGDKRGWWAKYCLEHYGRPNTDRYCMWRWAAMRNPANYFSRNICGIDVSRCKIDTVFALGTIEAAPWRGLVLLTATSPRGFVFPRIYGEFALWHGKGLMIDFGWKVKASHADVSPDSPPSERIKGIVLTISPWKDLP